MNSKAPLGIRAFRIIAREILAGKTIGRSLQNLAFSQVTLSGQGVDLGAKSHASSYYRFLKLAPGTRIVYTDLRPETPEVLAVDLEKPLPLADESQDFLILSNVLEHIYGFDACIRETARVLKKSGRLIGSAPFLYPIHNDPIDYFRYSKDTLRR